LLELLFVLGILTLHEIFVGYLSDKVAVSERLHELVGRHFGEKLTEVTDILV